MRAWIAAALAAASLPGVAPSASAQAEKPREYAVHLDPAATRIDWQVGTTLHTVHGTFKLKGGALTLNTGTGVAQGEIVVDATSGQTGNKLRDQKLQHEVLESQTYPEIIFHPSRFSGDLSGGQRSRVTLDGTFTLHGRDHPLSLQIDVIRTGNSFMATTHSTVPYVAWGLKDPSTFLLHVDKSIDVSVEAHGTIE